MPGVRQKSRFGLVTDITSTQLARHSAPSAGSPRRLAASISASSMNCQFEQQLAGDPGRRCACWYWIRKIQARFMPETTRRP